ncbi:hypothetical protein PVL29_021300 [Vitis rotundifolia]|uniref:Pectinesterase n=1 Tax=Vitis rotundifolia TaxID=103349 RepID=A0AA39DD34_VITRO|nr:hypothetical protein PVL29_021300 [Vitis rotundifolia]
MQNSYIYPMINVKIHEQKGLDKNVKTGIKTKVKVAVDLIILKLVYTTSNNSHGVNLCPTSINIKWHTEREETHHNAETIKMVLLHKLTLSDRSNSVVARPGVPGMQAVALSINGDKNTLMDLSGTHYFNQCYIQGSIDFIFGGARSIYQGCVIESIATTSGAIAAHRMESPNDGTGFSFVNCTIIGTGKIYLGRAWVEYSIAVYSNYRIANMITPCGWKFNNTGKGADRSRRVKWSKSLSLEEAMPFMDLNFIVAEKWLRL